MKICFLTRLDPSDAKGWSGTLFQMYKQLSKEHEVVWIGKVNFKKWQQLYLKIQRKINPWLGIKKSPENLFFTRYYAKNVEEKINTENYDLIFAPAASSLISKLKTSIPIIYLSDATFHAMIGYYPQFSGLTKRQIRTAHKIETSTLKKSTKLIFSSEWARKSAINDYKIDKDKISVLEFGANLLYEPTREEIEQQFRNHSVCNILFIGVMWERKGGDIAYKTFKELKRRNFNCTFTVIGSSPKLDTFDKDITIIPFIDKNKKEEFDRLYQILLTSHFLLLPTKAECFGIVFSEASAFGVPSLAYNTGGIPTAIKEGKNGFLLDLKYSEKEFADIIYSNFNDKKAFHHLRRSSRSEFEKRLSWEEWGKKFNQIAESII